MAQTSFHMLVHLGYYYYYYFEKLKIIFLTGYAIYVHYETLKKYGEVKHREAKGK